MNWETKQEIRETTWDRMAEEQIAQFPLPCFGRIPNFIGAEEASKQITRLIEFRKAQFIFSAPDYVLHSIREIVLQNRKDLLVATPHINEFLMLKSKDVPPRVIKKAVTIKGMFNYGKEIRLSQINNPLDLFCQGSVAIDRKGNRLGKGMGYGDREFHLLQQEGVIDQETIVITLVHDVQILDDFSKLMEPNDVKVHIALTPTEIIRL